MKVKNNTVNQSIIFSRNDREDSFSDILEALKEEFAAAPDVRVLCFDGLSYNEMKTICGALAQFTAPEWPNSLKDFTYRNLLDDTKDLLITTFAAKPHWNITISEHREHPVTQTGQNTFSFSLGDQVANSFWRGGSTLFVSLRPNATASSSTIVYSNSMTPH